MINFGEFTGVGMELVKNYVEATGADASNPAKRWEVFGKLLSNPVLPSDLLKTGN